MRPRSITMLSGLFVASGVIGLVMGVVLFNQVDAVNIMRESDVPWGVSMLMTFGTSAVYLVAGLSMLKARNWSRHLLAGLVLPTLLVSLLYSPTKLLVLVLSVLLGLMIWPLYRPLANRYFTGQLTPADLKAIVQPNRVGTISLGRKIVANMLYVISGFIIYLLCFGSFVAVGDVPVLPELLKTLGLPFVGCHCLALFLFNTPSRWLGSGITFLVGPVITLLVLAIAFTYPLPEVYADFDLKAQFSNVDQGVPVLSGLLILGVIQLVVGVLQIKVHALRNLNQSP